MIKVLFIVGPTASGKTSLSIELAKKFQGEIISADSMQIYKGIHIASAAPDEEEMSGIPHHLIEFLETSDEFSVAEYVKLARECIKDIAMRGRLPIIVGGTGLYVSSLLDNVEFTEHSADSELRAELEEMFDALGGEEMLRRLGEFDRDSAKRLHPNNRRRIIRAFEVYRQTGKTITDHNLLSKQGESEIEPLVLGINFQNRELLYERINKRVDIMLQNGLLEEAKANYKASAKNGAFQAIGHKELYGYIEKNCTLEEATEHLKQQTRRYAKRQMTWFRRDDRINWFYPDATSDYLESVFELTQNFVKEK